MDTQESDIEVEVTDLSTGANIRHPLDDNSTAADQRDVSSQLSRTAPPTRRIRAVLVTSVVLLAAALVTLVDPALRSSLSTALLPPPAPSPALAANANLVFLESGAPWGTFSLDGLETLPLVQPGIQLSSVWIKLTPGRHTLQVSQPPFPALTCTISLPAARSDTCPLVSPHALQESYFGNQSSPPANSRIIDLGARFYRLAPDTAAALIDAVRVRLSLPVVPASLAPGDHYLRDDGSVAVARTPLLITLQMELVSPDSSIASDSARCQSLCDTLTNFQTNSDTGGLWSLEAILTGSWRITTADGQVIAHQAPLWPSAPPYDTLLQDSRNLRLSVVTNWDGAWHITGQSGFGLDTPSLRPVAIQISSMLLNASPQVETSVMNMYDGRGLNAGQGLALSLTLRDPAAATPLYLYYHFGILLAANDAAHRAFPGIPVASAHELALARAIMGIPG